MKKIFLNMALALIAVLMLGACSISSEYAKKYR